MILAFDSHIHAAPSTVARWGNDLDLVHAAAETGVSGFVLKSHHESTVSRAILASDYARRRGLDCDAYGSIVLNAWISQVELERALKLGARIVWWPTKDEQGGQGPFQFPNLHEVALKLLAQHPGVLAATGHLAFEPALALVETCRRLEISVIATHPLNPDVGVGLTGATTLKAAGATVEVDARSLGFLRERGIDPAPLVRDLVDAPGGDCFASSDGGQAETGNPFAFVAAEFAPLRDRVPESVRRLSEGSERIGDLVKHE